jgi:hypothetical protein
LKRAVLGILALAATSRIVSGEEVRQRFGQLTVAVDTAFAQPGGVAVVRFRSLRFLGSTFAIFEGRRAPVYAANGGARALVPIPFTTPSGSTGLLGIELYARAGIQRLRMEFPIGERRFASRTQTIPEERRALLQAPAHLRDGRRLMQAVRAATPDALWKGPFRPPVVVPPSETFGEHESYVGGSPVEMMMDGGMGDQHRGLDYPAAAGTLVTGPAGGTVVLAEPLLLTGNTVVIDHGQGLVSMLAHLSQVDVRAGDRVDARARVGLVGDTGLCLAPHLHWAVYLHGIPVDPNVVVKLFEERVSESR